MDVVLAEAIVDSLLKPRGVAGNRLAVKRVDVVKEGSSRGLTVSDDCGGWSRDQAVAAVEEVLASHVAEESQWVSVDERLPTGEEDAENCGFFLVRTNEEVHEVCCLDVTQWLNFNDEPVVVTHWMRLPKLPVPPPPKKPFGVWVQRDGARLYPLPTDRDKPPLGDGWVWCEEAAE